MKSIAFWPADDETADLDEAPEPPADPISRPGDLWICGEHRVLCGDATVLADVEKVLGRRARRHVFHATVRTT